MENMVSPRPRASNLALTPPERPLSMPTQSFAEWLEPTPTLKTSRRTALARAFVFSVTVAITGYASWEMFHVVGRNEATTLQIFLVALFAATFIWIAFGAANALLGFLAARAPKKNPDANNALTARTSVNIPIFNEDVRSVFAAVRSMAAGVAATGYGARFDFFVLSDTNDPEIAAHEADVAHKLRSDFAADVQIYYRKRESNKGRKAGNIAEFVQRWGGAYDFMIVLDADSYMTAEAMISLAEAMQQHTSAGLIQTAPQLFNGKTLFARVQQFAAAVYAPIIARGISLWQGAEGNYWGHNAIIRVSAFAKACGLPKLTGRKPFDGDILSHDFVEAALLRRSGFAVYSLPDIGGSYEQAPPTLREYVARDRRWAQGNLQHGKIVSAAGLHWVNRFHMVHGIMAYIASPLWLMFLITGVILSWEAKTLQPNYFPDEFSLFPTWPRFDSQRALSLLQLSISVLLLPKLLGLINGLIERRTREGAGGALPLIHSVIWETIISALIAPILMLTQSRYVIDLWRGRDIGWSAQQRHYRHAGFEKILQERLAHMASGLVLLLITLAISWSICLWLSPVWLGLILAGPIDYLLSLPALGQTTRRLRLFLSAHGPSMGGYDGGTSATGRERYGHPDLARSAGVARLPS